MEKKPIERRIYKRVPFESEVFLNEQNVRHPCKLIDISLKGLLIEADKSINSNIGKVYSIELKLGEKASISMDATIMHYENNLIGLQWHQIDIESLAHLRRLLELNLNDSKELERELSELG